MADNKGKFQSQQALLKLAQEQELSETRKLALQQQILDGQIKSEAVLLRQVKAMEEKTTKLEIQQQIEENIKKAEESGNKLTQTINENDELIGVCQNIDFESRKVADDDERKKHEEELIEQEKNRHQDSKAANIRDEMKED